jgi:sRNA-binding carbon storage regulator CsrA
MLIRTLDSHGKEAICVNGPAKFTTFRDEKGVWKIAIDAPPTTRIYREPWVAELKKSVKE